jgi:ABC-2 type transport system permease protein
MSKVLMIADRQFRKEVLSRGFLIALLSLPLFIAFTVGMVFLALHFEQKAVTMGYVDQAGIFSTMPPRSEDEAVQFVAFSSAEAARSALNASQIDAYYVLPGDYGSSSRAQLVYIEAPGGAANRAFADAVRRHVLAGQSPQVVERLMAGPQLTIHATNLNKVFPAAGPDIGSVLPVAGAVLFAFLVLTVSSTLMVALVEEKDNRTMEVVVTSVSTGKVIAGKVLGIVAMAAILFIFWSAIFVLAVWVSANLLDIAWFQAININWRDVGLLSLIMLPAFMTYGAFMVLLGSTLVDSQEAQQVGPMMFMVLFVPIYLFFFIAQNPTGVLALAFSLFPLTSVSTMAVRSGFMQIPMWQYLLSAGIALGSALVLIWLAGKAFRLSMLRYGQRLRLGELFGREDKRAVQAGENA